MTTTLRDIMRDDLYDHLEHEFDEEWGNLINHLAESYQVDKDMVGELFFTHLEKHYGDRPKIKKGEKNGK